jgi:hypothetical protein
MFFLLLLRLFVSFAVREGLSVCGRPIVTIIFVLVRSNNKAALIVLSLRALLFLAAGVLILLDFLLIFALGRLFHISANNYILTNRGLGDLNGWLPEAPGDCWIVA